MKLWILAAMALAPAGVAGDWSTKPIKALYSAPLSAGEPIAASVIVRFKSDGYQWRECVLVEGSGDAAADSNPCSALPQQPTAGAVEMTAPVWIAPKYVGVYRGPIAKTEPRGWLNPSDLPTGMYNAKPPFGIAIVKIVVDANGAISSCDIAVPSGSKAFDKMLRRTFCRRVELQPATMDGVPVPAVLLMANQFFFPLQ